MVHLRQRPLDGQAWLDVASACSGGQTFASLYKGSRPALGSLHDEAGECMHDMRGFMSVGAHLPWLTRLLRKSLRASLSSRPVRMGVVLGMSTACNYWLCTQQRGTGRRTVDAGVHKQRVLIPRVCGKLVDLCSKDSV